MSDEAQPLYSDEGEHVGWAVEAEDGAIVALDLDATGIVGAMDPGTGELIDHSAYELDDGADEGAFAGDPYAQYAEQENQQPLYSFIPPPDGGEEEVESWRQGRADVEHSFDYTMTDRQARETATHSYNTGLPFIEAAEDLASKGRSPFVNLDEGSEHARRAARTAHMAERLQDINDPANADGVRPATRASYDLDDRSQRQQWAADRLEQRDLSDATVYNGSDSYPTTEEETWTDGDLD